MADAVLEAIRANAPRRAISHTTFAAQTDSPVLLHGLARASLEIDTAKLHVFRAAAQVDAVGAGAERTPLDDARPRGACGYACEVLRSAVDALVNTGGAGSFAQVSPVQRYWRDLNVASRHAFLATGPALEVYGRAMFGLPNLMPVI